MSDRRRQNGSDLASHLIGVIDIRHGLAVHAIAGKRSQYRPTCAEGVAEGDALGLVKRYAAWGVTSIYVADLDAICDSKPNTALLAKLAHASQACLVDAGRCCARVSQSVSDAPQMRFVLPTESYDSVEDWSIACEEVDGRRVIMGLDLVADQVRTRGSENLLSPSPSASASPVETGVFPNFWENIAPWIQAANALAVSSLLVLDLSFVGAMEGPGSSERCRFIRSRQNCFSLISGGGVRTRQDAMKLRDAGCDEILVGTALHQDASASKLFGLE